MCTLSRVAILTPLLSCKWTRLHWVWDSHISIPGSSVITHVRGDPWVLYHLKVDSVGYRYIFVADRIYVCPLCSVWWAANIDRSAKNSNLVSTSKGQSFSNDKTTYLVVCYVSGLWHPSSVHSSPSVSVTSLPAFSLPDTLLMMPGRSAYYVVFCSRGTLRPLFLDNFSQWHFTSCSYKLIECVSIMTRRLYLAVWLLADVLCSLACLLEKYVIQMIKKLTSVVQQNVHLEVFNHEDIEYGSVLGKGGEGIVQRCKVIYNELPVEAAVKTVLNNSDDALTITLDEIELLWYVSLVSPTMLSSLYMCVLGHWQLSPPLICLFERVMQSIKSKNLGKSKHILSWCCLLVMLRLSLLNFNRFQFFYI